MKKIVGYCDPWSVGPGQPVDVKVSTYGPDGYHASLVRVICGDDRPLGPGFKEEVVDVDWAGEYPGKTQSNPVGSYVTVPSSASFDALSSFTAKVFVYATTPGKGEQALIARWNSETKAGFALLIGEGGCLEIRIGDGAGASDHLKIDVPLLTRQWYCVWSSYDAATRTLSLAQRPEFDLLGHKPLSATKQANTRHLGQADVPLTMAALPDPAGSRWFSAYFNGKLERPLVGSRAFSEAEILEASLRMPERLLRDTVGAWDFTVGMDGEVIRDLSPFHNHGQTDNLPSRGCKGHNWTGRSHDFRVVPEEYGAIHFHDDDLYDAGWDTDFSFTVPADLKSAVYAIKLEAADDVTYVPLFVRAPKGTATAPLAFLAASATYMAYANAKIFMHVEFAEIRRGHVLSYDIDEAFLQEHVETGLSSYDTHSDGSGVRYSSRLRPVLSTGMKTKVWNFNADTHLLAWLEHIGQPFDVITDEDIEREGVAVLQRYRAVTTGSHPEYWSTNMWDAVKAYQHQGGRFMYPGGNGFYWRIAFHPTKPGVIEVRRSNAAARYWNEEPGEYHLNFSNEFGDLWRRAGISPQTLVGVGTRATGFDKSSYYRRTDASHDDRVAFMFEGISDEIIGNFGSIGAGAAGLEIDAADWSLGTPPHALIVASSEEHSAEMMFPAEEVLFQHSMMSGEDNPEVKADIVFYETPGGGAVFSVGSIAWCGSLAHNGYDNNVARLMENVVRRFIHPEPFALKAGYVPGDPEHFPASASLASARA